MINCTQKIKSLSPAYLIIVFIALLCSTEIKSQKSSSKQFQQRILNSITEYFKKEGRTICIIDTASNPKQYVDYLKSQNINTTLKKEIKLDTQKITRAPYLLFKPKNCAGNAYVIYNPVVTGKEAYLSFQNNHSYYVFYFKKKAFRWMIIKVDKQHFSAA